MGLLITVVSLQWKEKVVNMNLKYRVCLQRLLYDMFVRFCTLFQWISIWPSKSILALKLILFLSVLCFRPISQSCLLYMEELFMSIDQYISFIFHKVFPLKGKTNRTQILKVRITYMLYQITTRTQSMSLKPALKSKTRTWAKGETSSWPQEMVRT